MLLLITDKKSHTPCQIRWKSSTLNDFQGQYCNRNCVGRSAFFYRQLGFLFSARCGSYILSQLLTWGSCIGLFWSMLCTALSSTGLCNSQDWRNETKAIVIRYVPIARASSATSELYGKQQLESRAIAEYQNVQRRLFTLLALDALRLAVTLRACANHIDWLPGWLTDLDCLSSANGHGMLVMSTFQLIALYDYSTAHRHMAYLSRRRVSAAHGHLSWSNSSMGDTHPVPSLALFFLFLPFLFPLSGGLFLGT